MINIYAGHFNLNTYLRSFIREDIINEYEKNCLNVVEKYKNSKSIEVIENMLSELNDQLTKIGEVILNELDNGR